MQAEIIFTGNELLAGEVINTHAQYMGQELSALGIEVLLHTTVGDNWEMLNEVLQNAWDRSSDLIFITGGLGPTTDDLTKETVADFLGLNLVLNQKLEQNLKHFLAHRGISMTEGMKKQAMVPDGAQILHNSVGTAPGLMLQKECKTIVLLPGPPQELKAVFESLVDTYLRNAADSGKVIRSKIFKLTGVSESAVQEKLTGICEQDNPSIGYIAMPGEVHVRITARDTNGVKAQEMVDGVAKQVEERLSQYIFCKDKEDLKEIVGALLADRGITISMAESCTGGQIMKQLTDIPGSSRYLLGGVVAYSNEIKINMLGVPREIIERYGAVSEQTARLMAEGVRKVTGSSIGVGVTGIAGPEGGTSVKPVGLVYIGLAGLDKTVCCGYRFPGQRVGVRFGATNATLSMIRQLLAGS